MKRHLLVVAALLIAISAGERRSPKSKGHPGDVSLRQPASMSRLHEESDGRRQPADDGVFNNLVMANRTRGRSMHRSARLGHQLVGARWTELTFPLRQAIRWHDGKPFTAKDVKCTWDILTGKSDEKLRLNPRKPGTEISRR
jgi:peptide/nickel transport system substrate-binding protein